MSAGSAEFSGGQAGRPATPKDHRPPPLNTNAIGEHHIASRSQVNRPGFSGGLQESRGGSYASTDNAYSEAHFKMLKYRPELSERFENIKHVCSFCRSFFHWYDHSNRTSA